MPSIIDARTVVCQPLAKSRKDNVLYAVNLVRKDNVLYAVNLVRFIHASDDNIGYTPPIKDLDSSLYLVM